MRLIEFNDQTFDPRRILPVKHHLAKHPLLTLDALTQLAKILPPNQLRYNATTTNVHSSIATAPVEHRHQLALTEALEQISSSGAWIILMNLQTVPVYKALLDEVLDDVEGRIRCKDPGMFHRAFWVFIQSPYAVTPYHCDHEQNFLMQLHGKKFAQVWDAAAVGLDGDALREFHANNCQSKVKFRPEFVDLAHRVELTAGSGVYMPSGSPHYVVNTGDISIGASMTYCTRATLRTETIHRGNSALQRLGLRPRPIHQSPLRDELKFKAFQTCLNLRARLRGQERDIPGWARI